MLKHGYDHNGYDYLVDLFAPFWRTISTISDYPIVKLILATIIGLWQTFRDDHISAFSLLVLLLVIDTVTGVVSALKTKTFKSHRFRNSALKLFAYVVVIGTLHILGYAHPDIGGLNLDQAVMLYFSATEALSILENTKLLTGVSIPGMVLGRLGSILKSLKKDKDR